jgi:ribonuclease HII
LEGLDLVKSKVLLDGYFRDPFDFDYKCILKGDSKHYCIAAASIIAKVYRDNLMAEYARKYPEYGFEKNVGYGTKNHQEALEVHGVCDIHRLSYKPIRKMLERKVDSI